MGDRAVQPFEIKLYSSTKTRRDCRMRISAKVRFIFGYFPSSTRISFHRTTFIVRSSGNHRLIFSRSSGLLDPVTILQIPPTSIPKFPTFSAMKVWFSPRASICSLRNPFYVSPRNFTNLNGTRESIYRYIDVGIFADIDSHDYI